MADVRLRGLTSVIPRARERLMKKEPAAPPLAQRTTPTLRAVEPSEPAVIITPPPPKPAAAPQATPGATAANADALGVDRLVGPLAELAAHRKTATPLSIGVLGGAGSGKSFAIERLATRIRDLAAAAGNLQASPFLSRVHVQTVDAAALDADPSVGLAAQLYAGLRRAHPAAAREIGLRTRDPDVALRETTEKLSEARRQLDAERRALDDAGSRRTRLTETVLYDASGSQVDAYARSNRASIESRLHGFGIIGDPIRNYKDLVQLVAGSGRIAGFALRALWAYKGQAKLIVTALVFVAISYAIGLAIDDQASWLGDLQSGPKPGISLAAWLQAHMWLFSAAKTGANLLAVVCVLLNFWRAFSFVQPIAKGAQLLKNDLDTRRRDLDALFGHQTKRVDSLQADVERLTHEAAEAERHAGSGAAASASAGAAPFVASPVSMAQDVFALIGRMAADAKDRVHPQRIVVAVDHLDAVSPERARAILGALGRLAGLGIVTVAGLDNARLKLDAGEVERWVQLPVRLDAEGNGRDYSGLVRQALGKDSPAPAASLDPRTSALDEPMSEEETALLATLANLFAASPRAVRRLADTYAVARIGANGHRGILAAALAVGQAGTQAEKQAMTQVAGGDFAAGVDVPVGSKRLQASLDAAATLNGRPTRSDTAQALRQAAAYTV